MILINKKEKTKKSYNWDWLENASSQKERCFTFPQINPSLALLETVSSLDRKVPYLHGPSNVVVLCTTKVGTKRFQVPSKAEFDLRDPFRPPPQYNFLHDSHLTNYLMNPRVKRRLLKKGLLTEEGDVKCTIKEFNEYRQWIRKLKLDAIDKDWRKESKKANKFDKLPINEETEMIKQKNDRAKKLFRIQFIKEKSKIEKYMTLIDEKEARTNLKKKTIEKNMKKRKIKRNEEKEKKRQKREELEEEDKKYRHQILMLSKKNMKTQEEKVNKIYLEKQKVMETKVVEMWKRRQSYFIEKMEDEKLAYENEIKKRIKNIQKREKNYMKQKKKREEYLEQHLIKNRENSLKHLREASLYFIKMQRRKECEIQKWREYQKFAEKREQMLMYWRKIRLKNERESKKNKNPRQLQWRSAWDISKILLNQDETSGDTKMDHQEHHTVDQEQREELSKKFVREQKNKDINRSENKKSGIRTDELNITSLGNLNSAQTKENTTETNSISILSAPSTLCSKDLNTSFFSLVEIERIRIMAIEIINTKLLSAVDDFLYVQRETEESLSLSFEVLSYAKNIAASTLVKAGQRLGFDKNQIISTFGIEELIAEPNINSTVENWEDLKKELEKISQEGHGKFLSQEASYMEIESSLNLEVERCAKNIAALTLIRAGASLGYTCLEIVSSFGIEFSGTDLLPTVEKTNHRFVTNLVKKAVLQAALSLGYNQIEAELAVNSMQPLDDSLPAHGFILQDDEFLSRTAQESLALTNMFELGNSNVSGKSTRTIASIGNQNALENAEITNYAKEITAVSLIKAGISLGYENLEVVSAFGIEVSGDLLNYIQKENKDFVSKLVKKAVMQAALNLGYSEIDVELEHLSDQEIIDTDLNEFRKLTNYHNSMASILESVRPVGPTDGMNHGTVEKCIMDKSYRSSAKRKEKLYSTTISMSQMDAETKSLSSLEIANYAKNMAAISIMRAAASLGYDHLDVVPSFGIELSEDLISDIEEKYNEFISDMVKRALVQAALSLGYNQLEENDIHINLSILKREGNKRTHFSTKSKPFACTDEIYSETSTGVTPLSKNNLPTDTYSDHKMHFELEPSMSFQIADYAKNLASISLIRAGISLGYDSLEIVSAFGIEISGTSLIISIERKYNELVRAMVKEAVIHAALSLGYSQEEAEIAILNSQNIFKNISEDTQASLLFSSNQAPVKSDQTGIVTPSLSKIALHQTNHFSNSDQENSIESTFPISPKRSNKELAIDPTINAQIMRCAKNMAVVSLIKAAGSLGYDLSEIGMALRLNINDENINAYLQKLCSDLDFDGVKEPGVSIELSYKVETDASNRSQKSSPGDDLEKHMRCVNNLMHSQNSHLKGFKPRLNRFRKDFIHPLFSKILTGCPSLSSIQSDLVRTVASSIVKEALLLSVEKLCRDQSGTFKKIERIPLSPDRSKTFMNNEAKLSSNDELNGYANDIAEISLISVGISLGLDSNSKSSAFGVDKSKEPVSNIKTKMIYDELVRNMSMESVLQAALSLGYCEIDIKNALTDESEKTNRKKRNLTGFAVDVAKKAISEAIKSIECCTEPDLMTNFEKREELMQIYYAISNLKSNKNEASYASLAYNALRRAARSLGYSETEIKMITGNEKTRILQKPQGIETDIKKLQHEPNTDVNECSKFLTDLKIMDIPPISVLLDKLETIPNKFKTKPVQVVDTGSCKNLTSTKINSRDFGTDDEKNASKKSLENILSSSLISHHDFLTDPSDRKTPLKLSAELTSVIVSTPTSSLQKEPKKSSKKTTSVWESTPTSCSELDCNENNDLLSISNDSLFVTDEPEVVIKNPADFYDNKKSSFAIQKKKTHRYLNKRNLRRTVSHQLTSNVKQKLFRFYSNSHIQPSVQCDEYVWKRFIIGDEPSENTYEHSNIELNSKRNSNQQIKLEFKSKNSSQSFSKLSKIASLHKASAESHEQHLLYESNVAKNIIRKAQSSSKLKREFLDESVYNSSYLKPVSVSVNTGLRRVTNVKKGHNISLKDMLSKNQHTSLDAEKYSDSLNGPTCVDTQKVGVSERNLETGPNNSTIQKDSKENIQQDNETLHQTNFSRTSENIPSTVKKQTTSVLNKVGPSGIKLTPSPPLASKPRYPYLSQSVRTLVDNKNMTELLKSKSLNSAKSFRNARVRPFSSNRDVTTNSRLNIVKHVNSNETGASIYPFINDTRKKRLRPSVAEKSSLPQVNSADDNMKTPYTIPADQESVTSLVASKDGRLISIILANDEEPTDQMNTAKTSEMLEDKTISKNLSSDEMTLNPLGSHPDSNNPV